VQANACPTSRALCDGTPVHYERHRPEQTTLCRLVQQHAQSFFAQTEEATGAGLPQFVLDEFDAYLECGILAHGFQAPVPRPRLHLIRFHGVLAPNAKLGALVVPHGPEQATGKSELTATESGCTHTRPARISWARLLKRVFQIDLEHCPNCGGQLKIIAAILEAPVIERILRHLGLEARAPPRALARGDFQQAA